MIPQEAEPWVWTARYLNPGIAGSELIPVRTTLGAPRFPLPYQLNVNLQQLAPPADAFGLTNQAFFRRLYFQKLDGIGVDAIVARLQQIRADRPDARGLVLLCFEDIREQGKWCHRSMCAQWLLERAGIAVSELPEADGELLGQRLEPSL